MSLPGLCFVWDIQEKVFLRVPWSRLRKGRSRIPGASGTAWGWLEESWLPSVTLGHAALLFPARRPNQRTRGRQAASEARSCRARRHPAPGSPGSPGLGWQLLTSIPGPHSPNLGLKIQRHKKWDICWATFFKPLARKGKNNHLMLNVKKWEQKTYFCDSYD